MSIRIYELCFRCKRVSMKLTATDKTVRYVCYSCGREFYTYLSPVVAQRALKEYEFRQKKTTRNS